MAHPLVTFALWPSSNMAIPIFQFCLNEPFNYDFSKEQRENGVYVFLQCTVHSLSQVSPWFTTKFDGWNASQGSGFDGRFWFCGLFFSPVTNLKPRGWHLAIIDEMMKVLQPLPLSRFFGDSNMKTKSSPAVIARQIFTCTSSAAP